MSRPLMFIDSADGAGIMFHHFHDGNFPQGQGTISAEQFADLIDFVGRKRILDPSEWQARALEGGLTQGDLCLTFDDGLACQTSIALPVLEAYDIRAFWFIYTSPLEGTVQRLELYRYYRDVAFETIDDFYAAFDRHLKASDYWPEASEIMTDFRPENFLQEFPFYTAGDRRFRFLRDVVLGPESYFELMDQMIGEEGYDSVSLSRSLFIQADTIRTLYASGHSIGLHSHTHPTRLEELDALGQEEEYRKNREQLEAITQEQITCMSHPCNSYNHITLALLNDLDVNIGFRSNSKILSNPTCYEYPREDHSNLIKEMSR